MAEINQEPATKLKANSLRMAGKAICTLPTCVAARMPAKMASSTMNHGVVPDWVATTEWCPGGDALTVARFAAFSPEAAFSCEGKRDGFFKVGLPGMVGFSLNGRKE